MIPLGRDLRYALRTFRRTPVYSVAVVALLALGVGAASCIFSVVDRLLFRSLPFPGSDRIVSAGITIPIMDGEFMIANDYLHLRMDQNVFSSLTSWTGIADCDINETNPQRLACAQAESTFLPVLGIRPLLGRNFSATEDRPNAPPVALISYGIWQSRFAGSRAVLGSKIQLDGASTQVIGVLPSTFELPNLEHADFLVPQAVAITTYQPGQSGRPLRVFARLRPGATVEQARKVLERLLLPDLKALLPPGRVKELKFVVRPLRDYQIHDVHIAALLLLWATALVLLIAWANSASLILTRFLGRRGEIGTRMALGASRAAITRQALVETTALSTLGSTVGLGVAWSILQAMKRFAPAGLPHMQDAGIDVRTLLFVIAATLVCGTLLGLAPAFYGGSYAVQTGSRTTRRWHATNRYASVAFQSAACLILLSTAALMLRSLAQLQAVAPGMTTTRVLTGDITLPSQRYPNTISREQFFAALADRLRRLPGVIAVSVSDTVPPSGFVHSRPLSSVRALGQPESETVGGLVAWRKVDPEYFTTLEIPILAGRSFIRQDTAPNAKAIILSRLLAPRVFPRGDAVGRQVFIGPQSAPYTVVGITADVHNNGLAQPPDPEFYLVRSQVTDPNAGRDQQITARSLHIYDGEANIIVRGMASTQALASSIRSEAAALDASVPVTIRTLTEQIATLTARPRFTALLLTWFAAVAIVLAVAGVFGLVSFHVAERTREIGIRMAVGATPRHILRATLMMALAPTAVGVAVGIGGCMAAGRLMGSLLFHASSTDPVLLGAACLALIAGSVIAAIVPSWRASRIDPLVTLRHE